ncbi:MAG TPA: serine protease [Solirubrobacterales bacterium]|jgi:trypsin
MPRFVAASLAALGLLSATAVTQASAASPTAHDSIVRGRPAAIAAFPWLAHVDYSGEIDKFDCTGTVVAPRVVLTAGHCALTGTGHVAVAANYTVTTGVADLRDARGVNRSEVSQVLVFPKFEPSRVSYDASLLILKAPVAAPALALASPEDAALRAPGVPVSIAGWGLTSAEPPRETTVLHEADSEIKSDDFCHQQLRRILPIFSPASQLCIKSHPGPFFASLCHGDSGGPAFTRRPDGTPVQVGIISLGASNCGARHPQVLARVDRVSSWVREWIDAIEHGARRPRVVAPAVKLPSLERPVAEYVAYLGLAVEFGPKFTGGKQQKLDCDRHSRTRIKCQVEWVRGSEYYRGGTTVYTAVPREGSIYNLRLQVRRFTRRCWESHRATGRSCPAKTFRAKLP